MKSERQTRSPTDSALEAGDISTQGYLSNLNLRSRFQRWIFGKQKPFLEHSVSFEQTVANMAKNKPLQQQLETMLSLLARSHGDQYPQLMKAFISLEVKNLDQIIHHLSLVIDALKPDPILYATRGLAYELGQAYASAHGDYSQAFATDHRETLSLQHEAAMKRCYEHFAKDPKTEAELLICMEYDPSNAEWCSRIGSIVCDLGDADKALHYFQMARRLAPQDSKYELLWNYAHERKGANAHTQKGQQFFRKDSFQKAAKEFQKAVDLCPKDPLMLNNLGLALHKMGSHEEAKKALETSLDLECNANRLHNLARVHLSLENYKETLKFGSLACDLEPNNENYELTLQEARVGSTRVSV